MTPTKYNVEDIISLFDILFEEGVFDSVDFIKIFEVLEKRTLLKEHLKCNKCSSTLVEIQLNSNKFYKCHNCNNIN